MLKAGDLVCRRSYGGDLLFRVVEADRFGKISLRGVNYRVLADAPQEDLILVDELTIYRSRRENLKEIEKKMKDLSEDAALQGLTNASGMEEAASIMRLGWSGPSTSTTRRSILGGLTRLHGSMGMSSSSSAWSSTILRRT